MKRKTKLTTIVLGWLLGVVISAVIGFVSHPIFAGVAIGSIVTAVLLFVAVQYGTQIIADRASNRTERAMDELRSMKSEVESEVDNE